jgi:hypothetical protein
MRPQSSWGLGGNRNVGSGAGLVLGSVLPQGYFPVPSFASGTSPGFGHAAVGVIGLRKIASESLS